ncbi:hypothetical protein HDU78_000953, partial [Chytriomyces hyalinus]
MDTDADKMVTDNAINDPGPLLHSLQKEADDANGTLKTVKENIVFIYFAPNQADVGSDLIKPELMSPK